MALTLDQAGEYDDEDLLMLCCARKEVQPELEDIIRRIASPDLNWDSILSKASQHKIDQMLYYHIKRICPEAVPPATMDTFEENYNTTIAKNIFLTENLIRILKILKLNGIRAVPFKGPALSILAYGSDIFRNYDDIDLYIEKSDALKAKNIILSEGFNLFSQPRNIKDSFYLKTQSDYIFMHEKFGTIEIHWNFHGSWFSFPTEPDFLDDPIELFIDDYPVISPNIENLILLLSIHCARHDWASLLWICDIVELIGSNESIDWQEILEKAEKLCVKRILLVTLFLGRDLLGLKLPDELLLTLNSDKKVSIISQQVKESMFSESSFNIFKKAFFDYRKRENTICGIRDLLSPFYSPSHADFHDMALPLKLNSLYYIIRPVLIVLRYFGRNNNLV